MIIIFIDILKRPPSKSETIGSLKYPRELIILIVTWENIVNNTIRPRYCNKIPPWEDEKITEIIGSPRAQSPALQGKAKKETRDKDLFKFKSNWLWLYFEAEISGIIAVLIAVLTTSGTLTKVRPLV